MNLSSRSLKMVKLSQVKAVAKYNYIHSTYVNKDEIITSLVDIITITDLLKPKTVDNKEKPAWALPGFSLWGCTCFP